MSKHLLRVLNLGKRSFADALRTQETLRQRVIAQGSLGAGEVKQKAPQYGDQYSGEAENFLLFVEHWPVYTAGE